MLFFKRLASQDSLLFGVPVRYASKPPLCSMERYPRVETRSVTVVPSVSLNKETACRFGKNRRRDLLFACETLFPVNTPFPVMMQRFAITQFL